MPTSYQCLQCETYVVISEVYDPTITGPIEQHVICPKCGNVLGSYTADKKVVTEIAPRKR